MVSKVFSTIILFLFCSVFYSCNGKSENLSAKIKKVDEMYEKLAVNFDKIKTINVDELHQNLNSNEYILVDVRKPNEQNISMLPGAISISSFRINKTKYKKKIIVFYCTIGYRSGEMIKEFSKDNFDIYNLKGSILSWVLHGYPVFKDNKKVKEVHVYGRSWNILPKEYKAVW
ncbi:MAG: hypothetical protein COA79_20485 [Planctomycetota bacterium]|nr:MAG: hypothetical protein COA79_20485 [Planctomycetota bacterium]